MPGSCYLLLPNVYLNQRKFTTLNVPNKYFQFKKFRIDQSQTAMKVTTEGAILGAIATVENPRRILDIGAGTGLISLMLAQRYERAVIDAVEIDNQAVADARFNFDQSPWKERLHLFEADVRKWDSPSRYDMIVSNPPFFKGSLKSTNVQKNTAIHNDLLSQKDLVDIASRLLADQGKFVVIYPEFESIQLTEIAKNFGLYVEKQIDIYDHKDASILRRIVTFGRQSSSVDKSIFIIKREKRGAYTEQFVDLMHPFYLYL
ncbi:MAG: methyltransferase [Cyclobacteriaceae bacterium]